MLYTSGYDYQGYIITDYLDVISEAKAINVYGGTDLMERLAETKNELKNRATAKAEALDGNALIAINYSLCKVDAMLIVSLTATAVTIEKAPEVQIQPVIATPEIVEVAAAIETEEPVEVVTVAEEPAAEETAVEETAAEEPAVEESVVEEPAVEEPVDEEPAVEETVAEASADEELIEDPKPFDYSAPAYEEPAPASEPEPWVPAFGATAPETEPESWKPAYEEPAPASEPEPWVPAFETAAPVTEPEPETSAPKDDLFADLFSDKKPEPAYETPSYSQQSTSFFESEPVVSAPSYNQPYIPDPEPTYSQPFKPNPEPAYYQTYGTTSAPAYSDPYKATPVSESQPQVTSIREFISVAYRQSTFADIRAIWDNMQYPDCEIGREISRKVDEYLSDEKMYGGTSAGQIHRLCNELDRIATSYNF